jgi:hypothetical protein
MNSRGQTHLEKTSGEKDGNQRQSTIRKVMTSLPLRSNDNFLLLVLFIMGLSGFAYIFTAPLGNDSNKASLLDKIFKGDSRETMTSNFIKSNLLSIVGDYAVDSPIKFNLQGLSKEHDYEINFGDKCILPIVNEQVTHTYRSSGTYKIELKKISRGHVYTVHCDYLNIQ